MLATSDPLTQRKHRCSQPAHGECFGPALLHYEEDTWREQDKRRRKHRHAAGCAITNQHRSENQGAKLREPDVAE